MRFSDVVNPTVWFGYILCPTVRCVRFWRGQASYGATRLTAQNRTESRGKPHRKEPWKKQKSLKTIKVGKSSASMFIFWGGRVINTTIRKYLHTSSTCAPCLTYHAACKVEFLPPIGRNHIWRFSFYFLKEYNSSRRFPGSTYSRYWLPGVLFILYMKKKNTPDQVYYSPVDWNIYNSDPL